MNIRRLHEDRALRFEKRAEQEVSADLRARLKKVNLLVALAYAVLARGLDKPLTKAAEKALKRRIDSALSGLSISVRSPLLRAAKGALGLGVDLAMAQIGRKVVVNPRPDRKTMRAIKDLEKFTRQDINDLREQLKTAGFGTYQDVVTFMAQTHKAVTRVESTTRWVTNKAVNSGSSVVAKAVGARQMWVPEAGACLTCLAYAGQISDENGMFPAGLTFGDYSTVTEPIDGPPAHPNCRCRKVPWLGSRAGVGSVESPDALKREAQREVLRGTAQASEAARIKAADKLLSLGTTLPKTVQKRARRAVASGTFG